MEKLSPYVTRHIKRFGDAKRVLDVSRVPASLDGKRELPESLLKQQPNGAKKIKVPDGVGRLTRVESAVSARPILSIVARQSN